MSKLKIYHKPTCSTSRKVVKILEENKVDFEIIKYYENRFTKNKLKTLIKKMNLAPTDLLRKKEAAYKELDFKNKKYTQDEIISFMVENPDLIERPILESDEKAVLGRPIENVENFLK